MPATQFTGGTTSNGLTNRHVNWNTLTSKRLQLPSQSQKFDQRRLLCSKNGGCYSPINHGKLSTTFTTRCRKPHLSVVRNQMRPDCDVESPDLDECLASLTSENDIISKEDPSQYDANGNLHALIDNSPRQPQPPPDVKKELIMLSWPAFVGQAIDPLAQLMETAYIGRLGAVELGSAGVSMSIFNIISKLFNIPLLSVATSFVAEDFSKNAVKHTHSGEGSGFSNNRNTFERTQLSSVSTALLLAVGIGIFEGVALYFGSGQFLSLMGLSSESPMRALAQRFLSLRAIGAPAVVASLALQGIFRGFKDTKTPVLCLGIGNLFAAFLFPILMYSCGLGITGAAISTVLSQYAVALLMVWHLNQKVILLPPKMASLQFGGYLKSGGFLLGRTLAVLTTMTIGTSMAARQGPMAMAAHQICMQVWLAVSLLTDSLAASAQALIAGALSKNDYKTVKDVTNFVLKVGIFTGVALAIILGVSFSSLATLFTQDAELLAIVRTGVLFVSASQPLNALAYIFDGLHYGVSDFRYAANSMMVVSAISSAFLLYFPSIIGLRGVWLGLALLMGLRTAAGYLRLSSQTGPWWFLHQDLHKYEVEQARLL